jgi:hypothetical protein
MKYSRYVGVAILIGAALLCVACGAASSVNTTSSLIGNLRQAGLQVTQDQYTTLRQPFLSVPGHLLLVNGQRVESYDYATTAAVHADAGHIAKDACLVLTPHGQVMMDWPGPPHVFSKGNVIVLYAGTDTTILRALKSALGPQIAGV